MLVTSKETVKEMTNQTMNQRVIGPAHLTGNGENLIKLALVFGLVVLAVLAVINLRTPAASVSIEPAKGLSALPQDGRAYFTKPYWEMAAESAAAAPAKSLSALPQDGRAYFTEPYWEMAAELPAVAEPAKSLSALPQDGRAYFTEPYWEMTARAEQAAESADPSAQPVEGRAYFTEPYWNAGQ
jgi:hypothetical protein